MATDCCPNLARVDELLNQVSAEPWLLDALGAVEVSGLPDAWIGAGVIRDVIWGQLHGGFDPATVNDIDVAFLDATDLSRHRDQAAQQYLSELLDRPWEASNQAAVHTWYHDHFGGPPVPAFSRVHDAVATWPETATCIALRRTGHGLEVCAPHGLTDLLDGVLRPNLGRVSTEVSAARFARYRRRWPKVTVIPPAG